MVGHLLQDTMALLWRFDYDHFVSKATAEESSRGQSLGIAERCCYSRKPKEGSGVSFSFRMGRFI